MELIKMSDNTTLVVQNRPLCKIVRSLLEGHKRNFLIRNYLNNFLHQVWPLLPTNLD